MNFSKFQINRWKKGKKHLNLRRSQAFNNIKDNFRKLILKFDARTSGNNKCLLYHITCMEAALISTRA